ncbi:nuclear transport factor 2 family protein [Rhizobium herbae]
MITDHRSRFIVGPPKISSANQEQRVITHIPGPIERMVAATNSADNIAFLDCFSSDAFLTDWGRSFRGGEEIAAWNKTDNIGVQSHLEVVSAERTGEIYSIRMAVKGNGFNGEGIMKIILKGDRIAELIIS